MLANVGCKPKKLNSNAIMSDLVCVHLYGLLSFPGVCVKVAISFIQCQCLLKECSCCQCPTIREGEANFMK